MSSADDRSTPPDSPVFAVPGSGPRLRRSARREQILAAATRAFADVRLRAGTLYGALTRLEERGLVAPLPTADRRRPYRLTAAGVAALQAQLASLDARVAVGRQRLAADQAS